MMLSRRNILILIVCFLTFEMAAAQERGGITFPIYRPSSTKAVYRPSNVYRGTQISTPATERLATTKNADFATQTTMHFSGFIMPLAAEELQGGVTINDHGSRTGIRKIISDDDDDLSDEEKEGPGYDPADPQGDDPIYGPIGQVPIIFLLLLIAIYAFYHRRKVALQ